MRKYGLRDEYDAIVIGGGPAGSIAALTFAKAGKTALLVEKRPEIGTPLRCAEAVASESFEKIIKPRPRWIAQVYNGGVVHSPSGISVGHRIDGVGYGLDRKLFDRDLFAIAADAGADTIVKTEALSLSVSEGRARSVVLRTGKGDTLTIDARVVIAADGVESLVGRHIGLDTSIKPIDTHTCIQYLVSGVELEPDDMVHIWASDHLAPGGYVWAFPKGNGLANVGLGTDPQIIKNGMGAYDYLNKFVTDNFPKAHIIETHMGLVPASSSLKKFVKSNVALVGDAARHTDPFSGAGIVHALYSGKMAAEAAIAGIDNDNIEKSLRLNYEKPWRNEFTKRTDMYYKIRKVYRELSNKELDALAGTLLTLVEESNRKEKGMGVKDVFPVILKAFVTTPSLLLKTKHLV